MFRWRGIIWPLLLIAVGTVALLANLGYLPPEQLLRLLDLWPLLLVLIGLELIFWRVLPQRVAAAAGVIAVLLAVGGGLAYAAFGPRVNLGRQSADVSQPAQGLETATLRLEVGAATVDVQGGATGGDLFRAHLEYTGRQPRVTLDRAAGTVRIQENDTTVGWPLNRRLRIGVTLSDEVRWAVVVDAGASRETYDLSQVTLTRFQENGGASRIDVTLPSPQGTVPIRVEGGAVTLSLHRPAGAQARIRVSGGASTILADGTRRSNLGGDLSWQTDGYEGSSDRFDVQVNGGASTVRMDTR